MTRLVSFGVLVGAIAVIGFLFYRVISGFLLPMFLAALLVVIFQPWFRYFIVKCGDRVHLAALLTTISAIVVVIGPAILVCALAVWELWPGDGATGPTFSDSLGSRLAGLRKSLEDISHGTLKLDVRYDAKSCVDDLRYIESSIASLRKDAAVGATYRGDELALAKLLDAIDALKSIIKRDEDSSVTVDGTQQPSPDSRAKLDSELLSEVSETLRQAADGEAITPGSLQYQLLLDEADRRFRVFVLALYDNSASVWLADLMHPTDDELRAAEWRVVDVRAWAAPIGWRKDGIDRSEHCPDARCDYPGVLLLPRRRTANGADRNATFAA